MSSAVPPRPAIEAALRALSADPELHGAAWVTAVAVGSWAEGRWESGHDIDVRAVYVLPARTYLGLGAWWDEIELVRAMEASDESPALALDLVALELAKVARLALKGHRPTLAWLAQPTQTLVRSSAGDQLAALAARRLAELEGIDPEAPPPRSAPELYQAFDVLVRQTRLQGPAPLG